MSSVLKPMCHAISSTASLGVLEHVECARTRDGKLDVIHRDQLERNRRLYLSDKVLQIQHGLTAEFNSSPEAYSANGHNGMHDKLSDEHFSEEIIQEENVFELKLASGVHPNDSFDLPSRSFETAEHWQALVSSLQHPGVPSLDDFVSSVHESRALRNLVYARTLHMHVCAFGLEYDNALGNYLVPMFVGCGSVADAHQVFCKLACPNEYSWSALAQGFVECGELQLAIGLYQNEQMVSSSFMLTALLKACAMLKYVEKGQELHTAFVERGSDGELFVGNSLVDMYAK
eukprot:c10333_g1_i1 orf=336-1199(+)